MTISMPQAWYTQRRNQRRRHGVGDVPANALMVFDLVGDRAWRNGIFVGLGQVLSEDGELLTLQLPLRPCALEVIFANGDSEMVAGLSGTAVLDTGDLGGTDIVSIVVRGA